MPSILIIFVVIKLVIKILNMSRIFGWILLFFSLSMIPTYKINLICSDCSRQGVKKRLEIEILWEVKRAICFFR